MKIKTNKISALIILSIIFVLCISFAFMFDGGAVTASAATATTPKYNLQFTYSKKTTTGSGTGTSTSTTTGTVYSVYVQTAASSGSTVSATIYGKASSGTGDLEIGGYINSSTVNILINSSLSSGTIKVTNSSGTQVGSGSKSLTLTGLADGQYNIEFYFGGGSWTTSSRSGTSVSVSATSSFYVDSNAPTVTGGSTSTTGKCVNTAFTVSASDSASGVAYMYWRGPSDSAFSSVVASSKTIPAGSANGVYQFYARDYAGNNSGIRYVYYDDTKPTGVVKNSVGTTLTSSYTNGAFYYTASDSGCGISYLQYMKPNSSTWETYTSGTTIAATATNGKYQFRAVDKAGNISDTAIMYLDTVKPVGVLYSGTTAVSSGTKSTATYIKYVASDALSGIKTVYIKMPDSSSYVTYTSGAQMTINGTYHFYCVDNASNVSDTVTISLDNIKPTLSLSNGNFGGTFSDSFSVSATDNIGGTKLYYKTPDSSSFIQASGTTMSIPKTMPDGTYQFYAVDGYGNISATYSVTLSIPAPVAQIVQASDGTKRCIIWTDSTCAGTLDGESYVNGTWISTEGSHTFVLTNDAQRSSTYTFTIDHYYKVSSVVSPTCTADGYTVYVCDNCGGSYKANYVSKLGHNYVVTKEVESTCTDEGYSVYSCTNCGDTYNDDVVSANGHDYGSWYTVKDSTCLDTGIKRRDCVSCGNYETGVIEAKGHNYIVTVTSSTCTEQGYSTHVCSRCSDTYIDSYVDAHGHNYVATVTEATCTERGYTTQTCIDCGDSYIENYTDAHGHTYGAWKIAKNATCTESGLR